MYIYTACGAKVQTLPLVYNFVSEIETLNKEHMYHILGRLRIAWGSPQ